MRRPIVLNATDARLNLDRFPEPTRASSIDWVFIQGPPGWSMLDHANARFGLGACPCCSGLPLRRTCYCLGCDRSGLDNRAVFPGLEVGAYSDPDYVGEGTIYNPDPELAGGTAPKPARLRRGVARSRRAG